MDNDRAEILLNQISASDRVAFQALFDEAAPYMAAALGRNGAQPTDAENAIIAAFADIWQDNYQIPLQPGQSVGEWLGRLATDHAKTQERGGMPPVPITADLWGRVKQRAYPESWRNIVRRLDILFVVIAAFVWAILLLVLTPH